MFIVNCISIAQVVVRVLSSQPKINFLKWHVDLLMSILLYCLWALKNLVHPGYHHLNEKYLVGLPGDMYCMEQKKMHLLYVMWSLYEDFFTMGIHGDRFASPYKRLDWNWALKILYFLVSKVKYGSCGCNKQYMVNS